MPIADYPLRHKVNAGIQYNLLYLQWDACTRAGLDLWRWNTGGYPTSFMELVIAFHVLRETVKTHTQDAIARAEEKRARRKGRR